MAETDVARFKLQRVNPFQGLMIDSGVWRDAHEYHRNQMRLHQLALHGWGVVQGLGVRLDDEAEDTLVVEPGIAVDGTGNYIVVTEAYRHHIAAREAGLIYLLLLFSEVPTGPVQPIGSNGTGQPTRILEAYRIQQRDQLPEGPSLELARVSYDPGAGRLRLPKNEEDPGVNELDTSHRPTLGEAPVTLPAVDAGAPALAPTVVEVAPIPATPAAATAPPPPPPPPEPEPEPAPQAEPAPFGQPALPEPPFPITAGAEGTPFPAAFAPPPLPYPTAPAEPPLVFALGAHGAAGSEMHADGLRYLAREVGRATRREVDVRRSVTLSDLDGVDVVYVSGQARLTLEAPEVDGLRRVLDRGGVVVGEGCAGGPNGDAGAREFALSFADLASQLGRQLARVERGDALLVAHNVFSGPPAGARANMLVLEREGMVYSDADYGCAWQGGAAERPLPRGPIRDAIDFGVNLALYRREGGR